MDTKHSSSFISSSSSLLRYGGSSSSFLGSSLSSARPRNPFLSAGSSSRPGTGKAASSRISTSRPSRKFLAPCNLSLSQGMGPMWGRSYGSTHSTAPEAAAASPRETETAFSSSLSKAGSVRDVKVYAGKDLGKGFGKQDDSLPPLEKMDLSEMCRALWTSEAQTFRMLDEFLSRLERATDQAAALEATILEIRDGLELAEFLRYLSADFVSDQASPYKVALEAALAKAVELSNKLSPLDLSTILASVVRVQKKKLPSGKSILEGIYTVSMERILEDWLAFMDEQIACRADQLKGEEALAFLDALVPLHIILPRSFPCLLGAVSRWVSSSALSNSQMSQVFEIFCTVVPSLRAGLLPFPSDVLSTMEKETDYAVSKCVERLAGSLEKKRTRTERQRLLYVATLLDRKGPDDSFAAKVLQVAASNKGRSALLEAAESMLIKSKVLSQKPVEVLASALRDRASKLPPSETFTVRTHAAPKGIENRLPIKADILVEGGKAGVPGIAIDIDTRARYWSTLVLQDEEPKVKRIVLPNALDGPSVMRYEVLFALGYKVHVIPYTDCEHMASPTFSDPTSYRVRIFVAYYLWMLGLLF